MYLVEVTEQPTRPLVVIPIGQAVFGNIDWFAQRAHCLAKLVNTSRIIFAIGTMSASVGKLGAHGKLLVAKDELRYCFLLRLGLVRSRSISSNVNIQVPPICCFGCALPVLIRLRKLLSLIPS